METVPLMLRGRTGDPSVRRGAVSAQGGAFASVKQKPVILVDEDGTWRSGLGDWERIKVWNCGGCWSTAAAK